MYELGFVCGVSRIFIWKERDGDCEIQTTFYPAAIILWKDWGRKKKNSKKRERFSSNEDDDREVDFSFCLSFERTFCLHTILMESSNFIEYLLHVCIAPRSDHCLTMRVCFAKRWCLSRRKQINVDTCICVFWSEAKTWWGPSNGGVFNPLPHQIGLTGKELWFVSSVWNAMKKEGKERTEEETFPIWESCPREGGATKPSSWSSSSSSSSPSYYFYFNCVLIYHPLHMYLFFNHNSLTYIELDASTHKKYSNIGSLLVLVGRAQFLETHLKEKEILKLGRAN